MHSVLLYNSTLKLIVKGDGLLRRRRLLGNLDHLSFTRVVSGRLRCEDTMRCRWLLYVVSRDVMEGTYLLIHILCLR